MLPALQVTRLKHGDPGPAKCSAEEGVGHGHQGHLAPLQRFFPGCSSSTCHGAPNPKS